MTKVNVYVVSFYSGGPHHMGIYVTQENNNVGNLYHVVGSAVSGFTKDIKTNYYVYNSGSYIEGSIQFIKQVNFNVFIKAFNETPVPPTITLKQAKKGNFANCQDWVSWVIKKI